MPQTISGEGYREFSEPRFFEVETRTQVAQIRNPVDKAHVVLAGNGFCDIYKFDASSTLTADVFDVIASTNPAILGRFLRAGNVVNVRAFGAVGDGDTNPDNDDGTAIQSALTFLASRGGGILLVPKGTYNDTDNLEITAREIQIHGEGPNVSIIKYTGSVFQNVLECASGADRGIVLRNLRISGGEDYLGKAKYCFYAPDLHRDCVIENCQFRAGVGLFRVDSMYYAKILNNRFCNTTLDASALGITLVQWQTVWGSSGKNAPVVFGEANASTISGNVFAEIQTDLHTATRGYRCIYFEGESAEIADNSYESIGVTISGVTITPNTNRMPTIVLYNEHLQATVTALYMESVFANLYTLFHIGRARVSYDNAFLYNLSGNTLFYNQALYSQKVANSLFYRTKFQRLWEVNNVAPAVAPDVTFSNCTNIPGERTTSDDSIYDTYDTGWPKGMADGSRLQTTTSKRIFPKVQNGYAVTTSSDANGTYVQVTEGVLIREDEEYVSNIRNVSGTTTLGVIRLRPSEVSKYYRVYVNRAGGPYLVSDSSPFSDPSGTWIYSFQTDGAGVISAGAANPLLTVNGTWLQGSTRFIANGTGDPSGSLVANIGSTFHRTDGGAGTTLYIKEADNGAATGWAGV